MRGFMLKHRRRRTTVDALTAMYDAILATEPDVPLLFRLTSYRGQQALWQDHLGTVPVEDIGDPTGAVSHPETGDIFSVQTTDGSRPIWGGEDVGLVFDQPDNVTFLRIGPDTHLMSRLTAGGTTATIFCDVEVTEFVGFHYFVGSNDDNEWSAFSTNENGRLRFVFRGSGSLLNVRYEPFFEEPERRVACVRNDGNNHTLWRDGELVDTRSSSGSWREINIDAGIGVTITESGDVSGTPRLVGSIGAVLMFEQDLNASEIEAVSEELAI